MLIELSALCNKKCKHCFRYNRKGPLGLMDEKLYHSLIDQMTRATFLDNFAYLAGAGESFMHPKIYEFAKYARERSCYVALATNGTLIREIDYQYFSFFNGIDFSYDSIKKSKELRDLNKTDRTLKVLMAIKERGISTRLQITLSEDNWGEIDSLCILCKELSIEPSWIFANPHYDIKDSDWDKLMYCLKHFDEFQSIIKRHGFERTQIDGGGSFNRCKFMYKDLCVLWNGVVIPCCYRLDERYKIGNANSQTLEEIYFGKEMGLLRDGDNEMCNICKELDSL